VSVKVTFNSLSRDHSQTGENRGVSSAICKRSFNSLSRDHFDSHGTTIWPRLNTFNSLSRDHVGAPPVVVVGAVGAFNSLSRDHEKTIVVKVFGPREGLSTPSLGITSPSRGILWTGTFILSTPSLGITWQLAGNREDVNPKWFWLSTPSLGITLRCRRRVDAPADLSTPSLGITVSLECRREVRPVRRFQLPLSGSQVALNNVLLIRILTFNSLSRDHLVRQT